MNKRFLFLIIILLFEQVSAQQGWFWQYPKPQGNTLNDIFIFDSAKAIAVGDLGTVIKTYDGGKNWDVQHHAGGTDIDLYSVHFTDTLNGWACGGIWWMEKNVLLKTTDGGKKWEELETGNTLPLNAVYFVDADTGFVVGEDGIVLRTTDGGSSWDIRNMNDYIGGYLDVFRLLAITFTDKQNGFIVGSGYYGNQIYKTTDCGKTWQWDENVIRPKIFSDLNDICIIDKNSGFIVGNAGVFLKTKDGGNTWQHDSVGGTEYSVCFTDSLNGWIAGEGFILGTTDGGESWTEIITNNALLKIRFAKHNFEEEGTGWSVGVDGMIYKTTNAGENWITQREKKYDFRSIYFVDESNGWAVGDSGVILHTENGGANWNKQNQNDSLILSSVCAIDNQNVFAVGSVLDLEYIPTRVKNAIILLSTDGGQNWQKQIFDTLYAFNSIFFINNSVGWIASGLSLLKTTDKGNTWKNITTDKNIPTQNLQFINKDVGWGNLYGGYNIFKTIDGGKNWKSVCIDSTFSVNSFYFINADIGWAAGVGHDPITYYWNKYIYKTIDGGDSWTLCTNVPRAEYSSISFINENIGWAGGAKNFGSLWESQMIKTTDGGKTWFEQNAPNTVGIASIFSVNENICYAVGYDGIFKTTDGGGIVYVKEKENNAVPKNIELYQNFPNPFNPTTVINYQLSEPSDVKLKIYDVLGREIAMLVNKFQKEGKYSFNYNADGLSSGVYFYVLQAGELTSTKKMILIR
ncbi:MAG: YCF48-related protein [Ignavibacteriales bacterium]|nr:YCF48-related protein [Ignavibacteriales bacterium]